MSEEPKSSKKTRTKKKAVKESAGQEPKSERKRSEKKKIAEEKPVQEKPKKTQKSKTKVKEEKKTERKIESKTKEEKKPEPKPRPVLNIRPSVKGTYGLLSRNRPGKGFSLGEIREAGLTINLATKLKLFIDRRRKSMHNENVEMLRAALKDTGIIKS